MQQNKIETTKKVRVLDAQSESLKKSKARFEITEREVTNLTSDTKVYAAVGRMFVSILELSDEELCF